jgi:hypothetical protein
MPFKYKEKISLLKEDSGCDCYESYTEKECEAYRFTFGEINDKRNFLPTAFDPTNNGARKKCSGYAISLHETEAASTTTWNFLITGRPNLYKKIGTHISKGFIKKELGKCSESDIHLHFNFAEYNDTNLEDYFEVHKQIATDGMIETLNVIDDGKN